MKQCSECCKNQLQRAEPLMPTQLPELPWQKVGTDLFHWKSNQYLLIVDYYSRYIEISKWSRTTAEDIISHTKSIFARHGIPEVVYSDNGPQFSSDAYKLFALEYQFTHTTSSPYFPQSNGEAERAVGIIKSLLKKEGDPYLALLAYRSTPLAVGFSPAELLMLRKLRSTIPTPRASRKPQIPDEEVVRERDKLLKDKQKENFDKQHGARAKPCLKTGQLVWLPNSETEAHVEEQVAPRSYTVNTPQGQVRRNRRDLIELPLSTASPDESSPVMETSDSNSDTTLRRSTRESHPPSRLISDPNWT